MVFITFSTAFANFLGDEYTKFLDDEDDVVHLPYTNEEDLGVHTDSEEDEE